MSEINHALNSLERTAAQLTAAMLKPTPDETATEA